MLYFHGFSLQNEQELFQDFLVESDFNVAGFSYGAQQALEYAYHSKTRIDRLILLSPAFFQEEKKSFIRAQLRYFEAHKEAYVKQFLLNVTSPSSFDLSPYIKVGSQEELHALLSYKWEKEKFETLLKRGVKIEIFLGMEDTIIDAKKAQAFFAELSTLYAMKEVGHLLCP